MARIGESGDLLKCSFCGKSQKQVKKLIAGPGVYICDECIDLCNEIIEEEFSEGGEVGLLDELPKPHQIRQFLDSYVIGQTKAKQIKPAQQKEWALKGIEAEDKALAINPEFYEAMVFKNILLRFEANVETDQAKQKALIAQADELQAKGIELQKKQGTVTDKKAGDKKGKD